MCPGAPSQSSASAAQQDAAPRFARIDISVDSVVVRPADKRRKPIAEASVSQGFVPPFLKWTGGKQWLARAMPVLTPATYERYFEPFLGGGSVFFSLQPKAASLSDANAELIRTYQGLRDQPQRVIDNLRRLKYDREVFERVRELRPRTDASHAARFIYLNRTAFNGIYRVNREGQFNVPFGSFSNPQICNRQRLEVCAARLKGDTQIRAQDFEEAVYSAQKNDFVYLDPPYITGHMNNGFVKWNAKLFSWQDQVRLANLAENLARRGVHVLLSNADHPAVTELYKSFHRYRIERPSQIAASTTKRHPVTEMLAASYPLLGATSQG